ncbi:hypothetical protein GCM10023144_37790 [Pigmentiphaga soli]|uniref:Uncharacterized protein n=1 Tax=Pigmentiphaga soli TaxID=1007095 RepID=A0ABP8HHQ3_9BURK
MFFESEPRNGDYASYVERLVNGGGNQPGKTAQPGARGAIFAPLPTGERGAEPASFDTGPGTGAQPSPFGQPAAGAQTAASPRPGSVRPSPFDTPTTGTAQPATRRSEGQWADSEVAGNSWPWPDSSPAPASTPAPARPADAAPATLASQGSAATRGFGQMALAVIVVFLALAGLVSDFVRAWPPAPSALARFAFLAIIAVLLFRRGLARVRGAQSLPSLPLPPFVPTRRGAPRR